MPIGLMKTLSFKIIMGEGNVVFFHIVVLFHLNFITKYLSLNAHFHKLCSIAQQPFEDFFCK
jgi:hypothetical protein